MTPENFSNPVEVTNEPPDSVRYNFIASPGASYAIRGTVTEAGQPLSGISVTDGVRSGSSDTFGNYLLHPVPRGSYTVRPSSSGYTFTPASRLVVLNDIDVNDLNFLADPILRLTQPRATTEGFEFNLIGGSNRVFRLQYSTNDMASWRRLLEITNSTGHLPILDPSRTSTRRFYRAFLPP